MTLTLCMVLGELSSECAPLFHFNATFSLRAADNTVVHDMIISTFSCYQIEVQLDISLFRIKARVRNSFVES